MIEGLRSPRVSRVARADPIKPLIKDAQPVGLLMVAVEWSDGSSSLVDLGIKLISDESLSHIPFNPELFETLRRSPDQSAIVWDDGSRMSAEALSKGEKREFPRSR
jgi:hypothetical protein